MENNHYPRYNSPGRGLVILILGLGTLLLSCQGKVSLAGPGDLPPLSDFTIRSAQEVLSAQGGYLYQRPLIYLTLLPGPVGLLSYLLLKKKHKPGILPLLLLLSAAFSLSSQSDVEESLNTASFAYYSGKYAEALQQYQASRATLGENAALQYNIALCYHQLARPGYAIHALKQAVHLDYADTRARSLLQRLEKNYQLQAQVNTNPYFHPDLPFLVALVFFNLSFLALILLLHFKRGELVILFICLAVITCLGLGFFLSGEIQLNQKIGVIIGGLAPVKQIPDELGKEAIDIKEGTVVKVLWRFNDNVFIQTGRGFKGWIKESHLLEEW